VARKFGGDNPFGPLPNPFSPPANGPSPTDGPGDNGGAGGAPPLPLPVPYPIDPFSADDPSESGEEGQTQQEKDRADQKELLRKGAELLGGGDKHSAAGKKRFNEWWNGLKKRERKLYDQGGGPRPSKKHG
jgi:hypothetical protein